MTPHFLVLQLRFARSEFARCLEGVTAEDAVRRLGPMNCISWIIGHMANQEHRFWVQSQGRSVISGLNERVGYGRPASTPPLDEMWAAWGTCTQAADVLLDALTEEMMLTHLIIDGQQRPENLGTTLLRNIYHYWFHIGEAHAIRQQLGHSDLPQFVGVLGPAAYPPETRT